MTHQHFLSPEQSDQWEEFLPANRSVFGSVSYAKICQQFRAAIPRLYVVQFESANVCYPIFLRPLAALPFQAHSGALWDSTTPDYTGPMLKGELSAEVETYPALRDRFFREQGIIAEFAHLHPWHAAAALLPEGREENRNVVWVDTRIEPETLWREHLEHACRKNINTAQRLGVNVYEGKTDDDLREFYRIYLATMVRNGALIKYHFSYEFFRAFRDTMPANTRFVMARSGDKVIAATLYLYDDQDVFSFLGGADAEFQHMRPTNLVVWDMIQWAHREGKTRLLLGGGYKPEDGIFRFKSTFSPNAQPFQVLKRIHCPGDYAHLESLCRQRYSMGAELIEYFPSYRYSG